MSIRAVVFDIGGVLEFTPNLGISAEWEKIFHLQPGELDQKLDAVWRGGSLGKITEAEVHQKIGEILEVNQEQVTAFMDDIWKEYLGTLNLDLADFFRGLRPAYQTAIISNSFVGARERENKHYHFDEICDFIVYSHECGFSKPDRRIYELAWQRLGLQPEEIIFLDDAERNIDAARELGMKAILFRDNAQAITEIKSCLE